MQRINQKGFTLIELLVVIAVIGALAAVILFAINPVENMRKSRDARRQQDLANIRKALDIAIADGATGILPLAACPFNNSCKSTSDQTQNADGTGWMPVNLQRYFPVLPLDPKNGDAGTINSSGNPITPYYYFASDGQSYRLAAYLESAANTGKTSQDGGTESDMLEVGNELTTDITTP